MGGGNLDEVDGTVQTAVEGKVGVLGVDIRDRVGDFHREDVVRGLHGGGQVKAEGGKAALVAAHLPAIAVDGGHMVGALKLNVLLFALGGVGQLQMIAAQAAPIGTIGHTVLAVDVIPGMGQGHLGKGVAVLGKQCFGQTNRIAHDTHSPCHCKSGSQSPQPLARPFIQFQYSGFGRRGGRKNFEKNRIFLLILSRPGAKEAVFSRFSTVLTGFPLWNCGKPRSK